MPNLRFINIRFNLDAPSELAIYESLAAYPNGVRSQVVREALAAHLEIDIETGVHQETQKQKHVTDRKTKSLKTSIRKKAKTAKKPSIKIEKLGSDRKNKEVKSIERLEPESQTALISIQETEEKVDEREVVKGLLSMLH